MQMVFDNVQEEILAARIRRVQSLIGELVYNLETRSLGREELTQRVKDVERNLRKTREEL